LLAVWLCEIVYVRAGECGGVDGELGWARCGGWVDVDRWY